MKPKEQKGVFVTTYFSFRDALMQAYTLPYVRQIRAAVDPSHPVYLLSVEKRQDAMSSQERLKTTRQLELEGIHWVRLPYYRFGPQLLLWLPRLIGFSILILQKRIGTIHAWCMSGGVPGYLLSVLTGKRLIIDSFEPHAEVMSETGTWRRSGLKFKVFFLLEKAMAKRASITIACTADMKSYASSRYGVISGREYVKPACVDLERFDFSKRKKNALVAELGLSGKIVGVYAGKFGGLYLEQEVFDLCQAAYEEWGDRFRLLLLSREPKENVLRWALNAGLPKECIVQRFVPHAQVAEYMGLGDFGLSPYAPVPSRKHAAPIKNAEYWALGLPVIITEGIADDSELIRSTDAGCVIRSLEKSEYIRCIRKMNELLSTSSTEELYKRIRPLAENLRNFNVACAVYDSIYSERPV
jgi:glycosyltransferase involved in cell wall biosynthesis